MTNKYMYFIANWKMFGTLNSLNLLNKVIKFFNKFNKNKSVKIIYCPPTTLLDQMNKKLRNTKIEIGAQNCHQEEKYGAYTGSISALMLKNAGAKYVIIGHSENRKSGENDELINAKIRVALKAKLKVIFCIGESLKQKRKKITKKVLINQLRRGLNKVKDKKNILIAYEPIWSIGTGLVPKKKELYEIISFLKKRFKNISYKKIVKLNLHSEQISNHVAILAKNKNVRKIINTFQKTLIKKNKKICVEGRDIASKILAKNPKYDLAFYFKCNVKVASNRRWLDIKKMVSLKSVKKSLIKRTSMDKKRKNSPLIRVKDAILIRTDKLNKKQVLSKMSEHIDKLS